jgi:cytochrome c
MDRRAGASSYSYSTAIKRSKIVWSDRNMFRFIKKPKDLIPGNRMYYPGLADAQKRGDIIAYLRSGCE